MAKKIYFTITGTGFFEGDKFFEKDMEVLLEKEPDNKYDHKAILVKMPGIGKVGHVANSCSTVIGESYSAGRIYDKNWRHSSWKSALQNAKRNSV